MKKCKTYHPTIKKISIGDQFVTYGGEVVTFVEFLHIEDSLYPILMSNNQSYTRKLTYFGDGRKRRHLNIRCKILNLKDKTDLL